ncbi:uncharacterized protein LOC111808188 [Cucurbita pepo subsp. pepo]|uniref:uncharacterized protein LOC111808188 n=1 Tax=Cucurbita pepo subsp. pepo TaxID=3664 RepID=UPI000C9D9859|nr:uncharacterized protein LOC111808188 [Cucurbita pepo subsp. pepo]
MNRDFVLVIVFFVLILVSPGSDASLTDRIWNLHLRFSLLKDSPERIAPAPGPSSVINGKLIGGVPISSPTPAIPPFPSSTDGFTLEKCDRNKTCHDLKKMTACLQFAEQAMVEQYLLIQNDGETSLKVNVIVSDAKYKDVQVPEHHAKKVNVSDIPETSTIILDAGNGKCVIHVGSPTKNGSIVKQTSSYVTHLNLISGSYLLFSIILIIGGVWACCKMRTKERHANGIPYQELELAEHDSSPTNDLEAAEGWDQGWDDDWDESKPANKSNSDIKGNGSNGINSRTSERNGWGNDWDD